MAGVSYPAQRRSFSGPLGETRSRPGATVAGGPRVRPRVWSRAFVQKLFKRYCNKQCHRHVDWGALRLGGRVIAKVDAADDGTGGWCRRGGVLVCWIPLVLLSAWFDSGYTGDASVHGGRVAGRLGPHGPSAENVGQRGVRVRTDGDASNNLAKDHYSEGGLFDSVFDVVKKTSADTSDRTVRELILLLFDFLVFY